MPLLKPSLILFTKLNLTILDRLRIKIKVNINCLINYCDFNFWCRKFMAMPPVRDEGALFLFAVHFNMF